MVCSQKTIRQGNSVNRETLSHWFWFKAHKHHNIFMCFLKTPTCQGRWSDNSYISLLQCTVKNMWYLCSRKHKLPEEQEIHNMMISGDQNYNYWKITSYSFHSCGGAPFFYIYSPVKKASERPPSHPSSHIPGPQTENAQVSKPCWLCVPICPACHTSDNPWIQHNWTRKQWRTFYGSFSALHPKPHGHKPPFKKKEAAIYLALYLSGPCFDSSHLFPAVCI